MLGELVGSIVKLLDTDSHIIRWVALIFNVESLVLNLLDGLLKLGVVVAQEYTIVHIDHEDVVITKEDTVIN